MAAYDPNERVDVEVRYPPMGSSIGVFGDIVRQQFVTVKVGTARLNGDDKLQENVVSLFPSDQDGHPTGPAIMVLREPMIATLLKVLLTDRNPKLPAINPERASRKPLLRLATYNGKTLH